MNLVTGGTGLVGSHLILELLASNEKVRAIKRENSDLNLVKKIFSYYTNNPEDIFSKIEWINADVLDYFSLYDSMENTDKVYHCAAQVSFNPKDRETMMKINIEGTANIVNACLEKKISKLCHVSSIATLGRAENDGFTDEETFWKPSKKNSHYSISKYNSEREVWRGSAEGIDTIIVNPSVIIGPGDWTKGSSQLFTTAWDGLKFYTEGVNGYVDVRDVAKAMVLLMNSEIKNQRFILNSENLSYKDFFNICCDSLSKPRPSIKVNETISEIAWRFEKIKSIITQKNPLVTKETARTANQKYFYSNEKLKKYINYSFIPMNKSITDTCNCFIKDKKV